MSKITKVIARQVFDSRGNPTIEAEVFANNMKARAICPSGASTGSHEAYEKRDVSDKKYLGRGVLTPVKLINKIISKKLKNQNIHDQEKIDHILIKLDGSKQKKNLEQMHYYLFQWQLKNYLQELEKFLFTKLF